MDSFQFLGTKLIFTWEEWTLSSAMDPIEMNQQQTQKKTSFYLILW